jgi:hypothetical protein
MKKDAQSNVPAKRLHITFNTTQISQQSTLIGLLGCTNDDHAELLHVRSKE